MKKLILLIIFLFVSQPLFAAIWINGVKQGDLYEGVAIDASTIDADSITFNTTSLAPTGMGMHQYVGYLCFVHSNYDRWWMNGYKFFPAGNGNYQIGLNAADSLGLRELKFIVTKDIYLSNEIYIKGGDTYRIGSEPVADDAEISLDASSVGFGFVQIGDSQEFAHFTFKEDGTVTLGDKSTNVVAADTDANLCIYDGGTTVNIKNRLGSELTLRYNITFGPI